MIFNEILTEIIEAEDIFKPHPPDRMDKLQKEHPEEFADANRIPALLVAEGTIDEIESVFEELLAQQKKYHPYGYKGLLEDEDDFKKLLVDSFKGMIDRVIDKELKALR